jgi:hypothetical protein
MNKAVKPAAAAMMVNLKLVSFIVRSFSRLKDTKDTVAGIKFVSFVALSGPLRRRIIAHGSVDQTHVGTARSRLAALSDCCVICLIGA